MSAGSIVIDLLMKTGSFETDTKRAEATVKKRTAEMEKSFREMGQKIGLAMGVAGGALATLLVSTANTAKELSNLAQLSGAGTQEFQRFAAGAKSVGLEQSKLGDIFKDFREKVGEFVSTGGGGMKDFFEQIAPRVGITAEAFRNLSGPQALQLYVSSLEKANLSSEEMSFYLESMASDTTALLPLLRSGGLEMKALGDEAERTGQIMTDETLASARELSKQMAEFQGILTGFKNTIAAELLPSLTAFSGQFLTIAKDVGVAQAALIMFGGAVARTLGVDELSKLSKQANTASFNVASLGRQLDTALSMPFGLGDNAAKSIRSRLEAEMRTASDLAERIKSLTTPQTVPGAPALPPSTTPWAPPTPKGKTASAAAAKVSEAQRYLETMNKQLQAARDLSVEEKLLEDIQAGRLDGMTPRLEAQLLTAARQLDAAKEMDQFEKASWSFMEERDKEKKTLEDEEIKRKKTLADAGKAVYDATRTPMELLNYELERLVELLGAGAIGWDTYTRAADAASQRTLDALGKANEDDYWGNWLEGAETALTSFDKLGGDVLNSFSSSFGNAFESMIFDSQSLGDSISSMAEGMARSVVNALGQMAAQWIAYKVVQMVVGEAMEASGSASMISTAAATSLQAGLAAFASTAAIPIVGPALAPAAMTAAFAATAPMVAGIAALSGARATGGPVGADKTYLVGERGPELFMPNSSGAIIPNDKIGGGGNVTVNLIEDNRKAGKTEERTNNGKREMDVFVADIMGDGPRGKAIQKAFGLQRRGY